MGSLLPDFESAATQLVEQTRIYEKHIQSLEAYLGSGTKMEAGARSYEQAQMEKAKDQFTTANSVVTASIPEAGLKYSISAHSPTVEDYRSLFQRRQQALDILVEACSDEIDEAEKRQKFSVGLDHLLEARRIIE